MAVTVPVPLTCEEEAALSAKANAEGVSVDSLLRQAVLHILSVGPQANQPVGSEQWERELGEWLDTLPDLPTLSDEAISRDSIYTREDEWR